MKRFHLAAASGLALSAFLLSAPVFAQDRVDASGMPTTHSTPEERAQTADLNGQVQSNNQAADAQSQSNQAQYQAQQQQYQDQMQQNQAAQSDYQNNRARYEHQAARYEDLRARYAAETAAFHRGVWPDRYAHWTLEQSDASLVGQRVEIINGDHVGTVTEVARAPSGRVEALEVDLDRGKVVWIDTADIRYDRADGVVMTNLDRMDLHHMADERL